MQSVPFPSSSSPSRLGEPMTLYEVIFFLSLFLFVSIACIWPLLAWRIHHFSTYLADVDHSFLIHERTGNIYVKPWLGKFYVSLPWLWASLLGMTILTGFLTGKKP